MEFLLDNGADINAVDADGVTAFFQAADAGELDVLKMLEARGADTTTIDSVGWNSVLVIK